MFCQGNAGKQGILQREPFPSAFKKKLDPTECVLVILERIQIKKKKEQSETQMVIYSLLARYSGALLSSMLCGLPT